MCKKANQAFNQFILGWEKEKEEEEEEEKRVHDPKKIVSIKSLCMRTGVNRMLYCKLNFLNNLSSGGACVNLVTLERVKSFTRNETDSRIPLT